MSYIGREPQIGNFQMCDAISVVNNQASYTMQVGGVAVIPNGNFNVICSLNGVIQKAGTSFTTSSSTITFSQNLVTGDVIDFILILGSVLDLGVPSDGTVTTGKIVDANVTTAKIADNAITSAKLASGLALGKIGQVLANEFTSYANTSSSSFTQIGPTIAITPSASSSKILINVAGGAFYTASDKKIDATIYRGSTNLGNSNGIMAHFANQSYLQSPMSMTILDSPSTTNSTTYAVYVKTPTGSSVDIQSSNYKSVITVMEVLA